MQLLARIVAAALFLCAAAPGFGQDSPCGPTGKLDELERAAQAHGYDAALLDIQQCLGDLDGDTDPIVATFKGVTPDVTAAGERKAAVEAAISALRTYAVKHAEAQVQSDSWRLVALQLDKEELQLAAVGSAKGDAAIRAILPVTFWPASIAPGRPVAGGHINLFAPTGCGSPPVACPAYESQKDLIRVFVLVVRLGRYAEWPDLDGQLKDAELQSARWSAYFRDALPQYWWEVALNGAMMGSDVCPKDDRTHIQRGFCAVPRHQWILLHPEAGLQWVNGATSTDDLNAAFVVEILGRNSWAWKQEGGEPTAGITRNFGYSAVAVYSNRGNATKWSYGLMFHFLSGYTLGLTTTADHEFGLVVNSNLASKYFGRRQQYIDYLKALKKPALIDLINGSP